MKKVLLAILFLTAGHASAAEPDLTCTTQPGKRLCGQIRKFRSFLVNCDGTGCYSLWRDQIRAINEITDEYYETIDAGSLAGDDIDTLARATAKKLCGIEITGDAGWISNLTVKYNRVLGVLAELQEMANKKAYTCKFSQS